MTLLSYIGLAVRHQPEYLLQGMPPLTISLKACDAQEESAI